MSGLSFAEVEAQLAWAKSDQNKIKVLERLLSSGKVRPEDVSACLMTLANLCRLTKQYEKAARYYDLVGFAADASKARELSKH